jgi:lysophospholipase
MKIDAPGGAPIVHLNADPAPDGLVARFVSMADGVRLRAAVAPAGGGRVRGAVLIAPGRTETVEKYFEAMCDLAARGFASFVIDHRGQGLSDRAVGGGRGHIDRFELYGQDFAAAVAAFGADLPKPWIGLGHSMGGLIMLELLQDRRLDIAGAILSAPMTGLAVVTDMHLIAASALSRLGVAKKFIPGGNFEPAPQFEENEVTHDRGRYQHILDRLAIAPELGLGDPTIGWTAAAYRAMRRAISPKALRALNTPLLILSAADDNIVDNATHARIAELAPRAVRVETPGAAHEILTETDEVRQAFWTAFDAFVCGLGI